MGLFDWLKPRQTRVQQIPDSIWLTKAAKFAGIAELLEQRDKAGDQPDAIIVVAHFPDTLSEVQQLVSTIDVATPVATMLEVDFRHAGNAGSSLDETRLVEIVVAERHPNSLHDQSITDVAAGLPCRSQLRFCLSLEDPLMRPFSSVWVTKMLKTLGMKEHEAIESKLVAKRIEESTRKIAKQSVGDAHADSAEEWMRKNCPSLWQSVDG